MKHSRVACWGSSFANYAVLCRTSGILINDIFFVRLVSDAGRLITVSDCPDWKETDVFEPDVFQKGLGVCNQHHVGPSSPYHEPWLRLLQAVPNFSRRRSETDKRRCSQRHLKKHRKRSSMSMMYLYKEPSRLAASKNRGTRLRISFTQLSVLRSHSFRHILSQYKTNTKRYSTQSRVDSLLSPLFAKYRVVLPKHEQ